MHHYLAIARMALILGLKRAIQYRWDFLIEGGLSFGTAALQVLPLLVVFSERATVVGWSFDQTLVLMGWYTMVRAVLEGVIIPSLAVSVAGVRTGLFDYALMKPVDPMFYCSITELKPWKIVDFFFGLALAIFAFIRVGAAPSFYDLVIATILSVTGLATTYALFVLAIAASFILVRIQNLTDVLTAVFDFARWPVQVFENLWRLVFTIVIPLGVITTYPVMALLGMLNPPAVMAGFMVCITFCGAARFAWNRAIREYRSASS